MNHAQKIIWSIYLGIWVYIFFFVDEFSRDSYIIGYLIFGWIPFSIAHFMWGDKSKKPKTMKQTEKRKKMRNSAITVLVGLLLWFVVARVVPGDILGAGLELSGIAITVLGVIGFIKSYRKK